MWYVFCEYFLAVYITVVFLMVSFEKQKLLMLIKSNVCINIFLAWLKSPLFYPKAFFLSPTAALTCFSHVQLCETPWIVVHQVPLSMGFSRQKYWSGLSFPFPVSIPRSHQFSFIFSLRRFFSVWILFGFMFLFFFPCCTDVQLSKHCLLKRPSFPPIKLLWPLLPWSNWLLCVGLFMHSLFCSVD